MISAISDSNEKNKHRICSKNYRHHLSRHHFELLMSIKAKQNLKSASIGAYISIMSHVTWTLYTPEIVSVLAHSVE